MPPTLVATPHPRRIRAGAASLVSCVLLAIAIVGAGAEPPPRLLSGLDPGEPAIAWQGTGDGTVTPGPAPAGALPAEPGLGGQAWSLSARRGARVEARGEPFQLAWRSQRALSFWVYRSPEEAERRISGRLDVLAIEGDGQARFRRAVELAHVGWAKVVLPLRWFRWEDGRVPRWSEVNALGFQFPDGGELVLDAISVIAGADARAAELDVADLLEIGFPDLPADQVKVAAQPDVLVLSTATDLDAPKLALHLTTVQAAVTQALPFLTKPFTPVTMIVYQTREDYRSFPPRLARRLNAVSGEPQSDGYTILGIATSCWKAELGQDRPVYTHEYVHALLSTTALLPNHGEWVQEGLATWFQQKFHPQANLGELILRGVADPKQCWPLAKLCNGKNLPVTQYWQALALWDLLLGHEKYAPRVPALFQRWSAGGDTALEPLLGPVLETTWDGLTADWQAWCKAKYAPGTK